MKRARHEIMRKTRIYLFLPLILSHVPHPHVAKTEVVDFINCRGCRWFFPTLWPNLSANAELFVVVVLRIASGNLNPGTEVLRYLKRMTSAARAKRRGARAFYDSPIGLTRVPMPGEDPSRDPARCIHALHLQRPDIPADSRIGRRVLPPSNTTLETQMKRSDSAQSGVMVQLDRGQRRLIATKPFSPDLDVLILHEAPVISAPQRLLPAYRAWLIVRQIIEDPAKRKWMTERNFSVTRQTWDTEDQSFAQEIHSVCGIDPQTTQELYFSVATNHAAYWDEDGIKAGSGLFETLCFTNHSCAPNAAVGPLAHHRGTALVAIKPIAPGEEITWDYFSPNDISTLGFSDRQQLIRETYGFQCQCDRCLRHQ